MKWSTETPKESGFYWAKLSIYQYSYNHEEIREESIQPIEYNSERGRIYVFGYDPYDNLDTDSVVLWGDKLEVSE